MDITLKIFFLLLLPLSVIGQTKEIFLPERKFLVENWEENITKKYSDFEIKNLLTETDFEDFHRIWNSRQIIEVWKNNSTYGGQVISFTMTYVEYEKRSKIKSELLFKKVAIQEDTAKLIFSKFSELEKIPDMSEIEGWRTGFDGTTYSVENSTPTKYVSKSYWTPTAQNDSVKFKTELLNFINFLYDELQLYQHYTNFEIGLPYNESYTDGFIIMSKVKGRKKRVKK